ncbi:hypothetical protein EVAR_31341_1 [Eumeta japonica]|uniref:Uncharacterized protein n=1 Tax=Eumeta variegata TaxID=151549 RepID=A0A4C1XWM2_EUMVA|nr:hypothetical protein EVAR_31341_1 [Eumeta japonica]
MEGLNHSIRERCEAFCDGNTSSRRCFVLLCAALVKLLITSQGGLQISVSPAHAGLIIYSGCHTWPRALRKYLLARGGADFARGPPMNSLLCPPPRAEIRFRFNFGRGYTCA